ncbi:glycerol-3-phosphate ABC transporter permease [Thermosipho melanesiensis]|uniref:Binding-protein-dependent transport systems inner membrane component n=2 Tax=Thermosipho melanesiensis TaxID=46541 RepID=A6LL13_THEM4|nr:carbohydrate ABC transporter permease [Thermosipho melanesiensis]ABR30614.1 binding-protein-dependent transport systems inner membrane component [Thermosipho melanesiensis BI429]APT73754.1 glycerol-3-phosphate ABC transporter permease [Thermosipho melanesiensis]OOC35695.1 glycerol-3-phosphate ABC transporter permease [Thermosipho melanesiensis]OOC38994.1 glycerol-3-phosphate ABC transporter permease [Thermosipho melanesiensis]OOC39142.1 glycerol-3-phosphate ABC transporter permease [Thermos
MKIKNKFTFIILELLLILIGLIMFAPILLAFFMSFMKPAEVFSFPPKVFPSSFYWQNYKEALKLVPLGRMLVNSIIVSAFITLGKLITGILAGYAFANFSFKGKKMAFSTLFITLFLPAETVMIVPMFLLMKALGWVNTYYALIIPFTASATNTFLMRQHFRTIPMELNDAARIDGATPMQYLVKVLLPLSKAMIGGAALINFVYAWNMYLWPLVVTMEDEMKTVQIGVKMLIDAEAANNWGTIMAGTMIALAPTLLIFFLIQNLFVRSLVSSGLKG